jgi:cell volume regulation protein A
MDVIYLAVSIGALLLIVSVLSSLIAFRIGTPLLLIFLTLGLLAGEDVIGIPFDDPDTAYLIGSVALAIILFESGFETSFRSYRTAAWPAIVLATVGVALTAGFLGLAAYWLLGLTLLEGFLIGAIVGSTDAAAVFFLLRVGGITIRERVRSTLEVESSSNDPMAIFLTMALVELIASGAQELSWKVALDFVFQMGGGAVAGVVAGLLFAIIFNKLALEPALYGVLSLAYALFVFGSTSLIGASGFLAVYVAGLLAGNAPLRKKETLRGFHNGLTWLSQIVMFLTLGLFATPSQFPSVALPAIILGLLLIVLARPSAVWLCLLPFRFSRNRFSRNEVIFVAWVGLRGAVSILLAIVPMMGGLEISEMVFNLVFLIVLVSLLVQGGTVHPVARWLGLIVPRQPGPRSRFEIELPGQETYALVAYTIAPDSKVARGARLPRWARPSLIVRGDTVLTIHNVRNLQAYDQVYLFTSPARLPLLDKLFEPGPEISEDDREFFGDLVLRPETKLSTLAETYGLPVAIERADITLAELFRKEFNHPELGDRLRIGGVELVVREMNDDLKVTSVGLALEPTGLARPHLLLLQGPSDIWNAVRSLIQRLQFWRWIGKQKQKAD